MTMRILLYRGVSLFSQLVRWRTWSDYSHAALEHKGKIIEAWHGGVRMITHPLEGHHPRTGIEAYSVTGLTFAGAEGAWAFALAQLGKPYDYLGVLRFLTRRDSANDLWFCSELVFESLRVGAGIELLARTPACRVSPGDLARSPLLVPSPLQVP